MFGENKGDEVCKIDEAARGLRTQIDDLAREGNIKLVI